MPVVKLMAMWHKYLIQQLTVFAATVAAAVVIDVVV